MVVIVMTIVVMRVVIIPILINCILRVYKMRPHNLATCIRDIKTGSKGKHAQDKHYHRTGRNPARL